MSWRIRENSERPRKKQLSRKGSGWSWKGDDHYHTHISSVSPNEDNKLKTSPRGPARTKCECEPWLHWLKHSLKEPWGHCHFIIPLWASFVRCWTSRFVKHRVLGLSSTDRNKDDERSGEEPLWESRRSWGDLIWREESYRDPTLPFQELKLTITRCSWGKTMLKSSRRVTWEAKQKSFLSRSVLWICSCKERKTPFQMLAK